MTEDAVHRYRAGVRWTGSTGVGYDAYDRTHALVMPPADGTWSLSGDAAFRGDPALANPEGLLLAAASSCQLLAFLALAARSRIDVLAYEDDAAAEMPEAVRPVRITRIVLAPRIEVAAGTSVDRVQRLVDHAHRECYVANTLNCEVVVQAVVRVRGRG